MALRRPQANLMQGRQDPRLCSRGERQRTEEDEATGHPAGLAVSPTAADSFRGPAGRLAWRQAGSGEPLLMINGYAAGSLDWDPTFLAVLARDSTLILPDNRGIGESEGSPESITIDSMAEDAFALLDHLGIASAHVLGWSMGGFIAQTLTLAEPDRVKTLTLLSTDPGGSLAVRRTAEADRRLTDHSGTPREQARRLLGLLFPPDVAEDLFGKFGDVVAEARASLRPAVLTAQEEAMERWYERPDSDGPAGIGAPSLVACGELDEVIPPANTTLLNTEITGSRIRHFPEGGHAFMAQFPEQLGGLVSGFLRGES